MIVVYGKRFPFSKTCLYWRGQVLVKTWKILFVETLMDKLLNYVGILLCTLHTNTHTHAYTNEWVCFFLQLDIVFSIFTCCFDAKLLLSKIFLYIILYIFYTTQHCVSLLIYFISLFSESYSFFSSNSLFIPHQT